jgi:EpsI family protein
MAILLAAAAAEAMTPRTLMAQSAASLDLETLIPKSFGQWKPVPGVRVIEPPGSDYLAHEIYSQEIARGFVDEEGHVVMMLVAYGVSQSDRLQLHRPEICYAANGFRVSRPFGATLSYLPGRLPIRLTRMIAQREGRLEPVTYWMRIGNDIATGVVERQILKVKYGLRGLIPDGALIRISTVGIPEDAAFALQDRFIRDLLKSVDQPALNFLTGNPTKALSLGI